MGKKYIFTGENVNITSAFIVGKIYESVGDLNDFGAFINERGEKDGYLGARNNKCFKEVTEEQIKTPSWPFAIALTILICFNLQGQDSYSARKDSTLIKTKSERRENRKKFVKKLPALAFQAFCMRYYLKPKRWY